jgi:hypothetical protein
VAEETDRMVNSIALAADVLERSVISRAQAAALAAATASPAASAG